MYNEGHTKQHVILRVVGVVKRQQKFFGSCKFGVRNQSYNGCKQGIRTPNKTYAKALTTAAQSPYEFARCMVLGRVSGKTLMAQGISYQNPLGF